MLNSVKIMHNYVQYSTEIRPVTMENAPQSTTRQSTTVTTTSKTNTQGTNTPITTSKITTVDYHLFYRISVLDFFTF